MKRAAISACLALAGAIGCGETKIVAITPGADAAGGGVDDRGRVEVRGGTVVTDRGTRLRGVTIPIDVAPTFPLTSQLFDDLANVAGLNAVHVYLENWSHETGQHAQQADALVDLTSRAGMYVILAMAGGPSGPGHGGTGTFDLDKLRSFWTFYASRYAARTHVLYEIQNYPEDTCNALASVTIDMEREISDDSRRRSHDDVLLLSYGAIPSPAPLGLALDQLADRVDWSNASVAFHTQQTCTSLADLSALLRRSRARARTAFLFWRVKSSARRRRTSRFEPLSVGWMSKRWLVTDWDPATFRQELTAARTTWCPDFGDWPEPSSSVPHALAMDGRALGRMGWAAIAAMTMVSAPAVAGDEVPGRLHRQSPNGQDCEAGGGGAQGARLRRGGHPRQRRFEVVCADGKKRPFVGRRGRRSHRCR